jgi:hypothetical protein
MENPCLFITEIKVRYVTFLSNSVGFRTNCCDFMYLNIHTTQELVWLTVCIFSEPEENVANELGCQILLNIE